MENGVFIADINKNKNKEISEVLYKLNPSFREQEIDIKCFHDNSEDEERIYDVYLVSCDNKKYVLKYTTKDEVEIYKNYLSKSDFKVPQYFDSIQVENHHWILTSFIAGNDGKQFTKEIAVGLARNLSKILNEYWIEEGISEAHNKERFERYWQRINKRRQCLYNYPKLAEAYDKFLERQKICPLTLCNGDLMQVNIIANDEDVYIIDWAFGGFMPYALEVARVISHGAAEDFPYFMTDELREMFIRKVYENLSSTKLTFEEFCYDVRLACLNEIIEFLEYNFNNPDEQRDKYFDLDFRRAEKLAEEILDNQGKSKLILLD